MPCSDCSLWTIQHIFKDQRCRIGWRDQAGDHPWDYAASYAARIFSSMLSSLIEASPTTCLLYREQADLKALLPALSKSTWACRLHGHARPICNMSSLQVTYKKVVSSWIWMSIASVVCNSSCGGSQAQGCFV